MKIIYNGKIYYVSGSSFCGAMFESLEDVKNGKMYASIQYGSVYKDGWKIGYCKKFSLKEMEERKLLGIEELKDCTGTIYQLIEKKEKEKPKELSPYKTGEEKLFFKIYGKFPDNIKQLRDLIKDINAKRFFLKKKE